jgi:PhnB protein
MAGNVKPVPDGFHSVTPYLVVDGAASAIDFYTRALGANELFRMPDPSGKIAHAEIQVGDSRILLSDEFPERGEMGGKSPKTLSGSAVSIFIYTEDVDALFNRAVAAGATVKLPPTDMFWGDRWSHVVDPFGHEWQFATHVEDLTPEQMGERAAAAMGG